MPCPTACPVPYVSLILCFVLALDDKARDLSVMSQKYRKDARYLNLHSSYVKIGAIIIIVVLLLLFLRYLVF